MSSQVVDPFITVRIPIVNQKVMNTRTGGVIGFYWNSYSKSIDLEILKFLKKSETIKLKQTVLQGF